MLKNPKGAPFQFFGIVRLFSKFFLSKGSPFNFFDISQHIGCLKIPKGPSFQFFGIVRLRKFVFFSPKGPPSTATKMLTISEVSPFFPRNIPYRARAKGPPFQFFSALRDFFSEKFFPKGSPFNFFAFLFQNGCRKIPKGPPLQFFRHCEIFFRKINNSPLQFFDVLRHNGC